MSYIKFLDWLRPGGPWTPAAIHPNGRIEVRTILKLKKVEPWVEERIDTCGIFYTINHPKGPVSKKPSREDIAEMAWLHVDIDPRAGHDLEAEQERILALKPEGIPEPSCTIFSGGGIQHLWRLETPVPINGDPALYEEAKLYNIYLEQAYGADACHNVDRLGRLPGTWNIPTPIKLKKHPDRKKVLTQIITINDNCYPIESCKKATQGIVTATGVQVDLTRPQTIDSLDDLDEWEVPRWCRKLILQGDDPQNPTKYESRSEALFAAVCELVRSGVPDAVVYGIITDEEYGISASVLDKGQRIESYARKQIRDAKEKAIDPDLLRLNSEFCVIRAIGGKCMVIHEKEDENLNRPELVKQSFTAFKEWHRKYPRKVVLRDEGKPSSKSLGDWWLDHPQRRDYYSIVFKPEGQANGDYNLWRGFSVKPVEGTAHQIFLTHVRENLCRGNEEHYDYLYKWMARCIQVPGRPGETGVVLQGKQGTGKGIFARHFGRLFGRHYMQVTNTKHLVGNFNAHLRDCVLLFADEAFYAGDKQHQSTLKSLVTEPHLMVEGKGVDAEVAANCVHLIMASNADWVVPADLDERRFLILSVSDKYAQDEKYFAAIEDAMVNGGSASLLHELQNVNLEGFKVRTVPKTRALSDQKELSLDPWQDWWLTKLEEGRVLPSHEAWNNCVQRQALYNDYVKYAQKLRRRVMTNAELGKAIKKVMPKGFPDRKYMVGTRLVENEEGQWVEVTGKRVNHSIFPGLLECRDSWEEQFGAKHEWPKDDDDNAEGVF